MDIVHDLNPKIREYTSDNSTLNSQEANMLTKVFDRHKTGILNIWENELSNLRNAIKATQTQLGMAEKTGTRRYITNTDKKAIREIAESNNQTSSTRTPTQVPQTTSEAFWDMQWDIPLKSKEEFDAKYQEFTHTLEQDLGLSVGIGSAMAYVESHYGQYLNSKSGSKWILQLTAWPFWDMRWDHTPAGKRRIPYNDMEKVEEYRDIFKKINIPALKSIDMGDGSTIGESMDNDVWEKLQQLQDDSITSRQAASIIDELKDMIKWSDDTYHHTLNIIIWEVYYAYLYQNSDFDLKKALIKYNGDNTRESDGRAHKYHYADKVMQKFTESLQ